MNNTLPYLFYINDKITTHNNNVFHTKPGQTFKFLVQNIHFSTCPFHFKLSTIPSQTNNFHHELLFSRIACMKFWHIRWSCKWCIDGTFKDFTQTFSKSFIYGYKFIISKLETQWKLKICTFMNNSLSSIKNGHLLKKKKRNINR
jgi:hypothetical protein